MTPAKCSQCYTNTSMLWIRTVKTSWMNESSYSSKNLHQRLTRCSCEYSSVVILLYLTDIGMQAAAFGKDLRGDLQGKKKKSSDGQVPRGLQSCCSVQSYSNTKEQEAKQREAKFCLTYTRDVPSFCWGFSVTGKFVRWFACFLVNVFNFSASETQFLKEYAYPAMWLWKHNKVQTPFKFPCLAPVNWKHLKSL